MSGATLLTDASDDFTSDATSVSEAGPLTIRVIASEDDTIASRSFDRTPDGENGKIHVPHMLQPG